MHASDAFDPMRFPLALLVLWLSFGTIGCAATRSSALKDGEEEIMTARQKGDLQRLLDEADAHWKKRGERDQLERAIELYEKAVETESPDLSETKRKSLLAATYVRLARAYFFLANSHVALGDMLESKRQSAMNAHLEKSLSAAERGIVLADPDLAEAISGGKALAEMVSDADPAAVPPLYWYATALGKWGMMQGMATIMKYRSDIQETMTFVCDTQSDYFHGGCHRYFGAYWSRVPLGKDLDKTRNHLQKALEIAPYFLGNKVLMAEYYARPAGKSDLYEKLLREVIEAPTAPEGHADVAPENRFHQKRARQLLDGVEKASR